MAFRKTFYLFLLFGLFIIPNLCFSEVGPITLEELINTSDYIIIGKTGSVKRVNNLRVAEVEVIMVLKGESDIKKIYYLAQKTWECDTSTAEEGETCLFFFYANLTDMNLEIRDIYENIKNTPYRPFYRINHSGRGRMPISKIDGMDYATLWVGDVRLPDNIKTIPGPEPEHDFIRSVLLKEMEDFIIKVKGVEPVKVKSSINEPDKVKSSTKGKCGRCGLFGIEALFLLLVLRVIKEIFTR